MLMGDIEPELLLANIPSLDAVHAAETPQQHEERMQRYAVAYKKFDEAMAVFMTDIHGKVRTSKREALVEQETQSKSEDQDAMHSIESSFQ